MNTLPKLFYWLVLKINVQKLYIKFWNYEIMYFKYIGNIINETKSINLVIIYRTILKIHYLFNLFEFVNQFIFF